MLILRSSDCMVAVFVLPVLLGMGRLERAQTGPRVASEMSTQWISRAPYQRPDQNHLGLCPLLFLNIDMLGTFNIPNQF